MTTLAIETWRRRIAWWAAIAMSAGSVVAWQPARAQTPADDADRIGRGGDIPAHFKPDTDGWAYEKRELTIPMRDGVQLHAVAIVPKGGRNLPIVLDRTPYSAKDTLKGDGPNAAAATRSALDRDLVEHG